MILSFRKGFLSMLPVFPTTYSNENGIVFLAFAALSAARVISSVVTLARRDAGPVT
jgi:hypothetical protein